MASRGDRLLDVEAAVAEGGESLRRRHPVRALELVRGVYEPHALPAAASRGLEQHRIAELASHGACLGRRRRALRPRHDRDPGGAQLGLRPHLVAHALHDLRVRPDEDEVVLRARLDEGRILGQEAVPRMDRLAARRLRGGDDRGNVEVALRRRRRSDTDGAVGQADVQRVLVGRRVDGDGLDPELVRARITRTAISPRLATRTRVNMEIRRGWPAVDRLELEQQLPVLDRLGVLDVDRPDDSLDLGLDLVHQLHRLEDAERLPGATKSPSWTNGAAPGSGAR